MKRSHAYLFLIGGFFAMFAAAPHGALAATCTFIPVLGTDFHQTVNWNCDKIPDANDDIIINFGDAVSVGQAVSVKTATVGGTLNIGSSNFDSLGNVTVDGGNLVIGSGRVNVYSGILDVKDAGSVTMATGVLESFGNAFFTSGSFLELNSGALLVRGSLTFDTNMTFRGGSGLLDVQGNVNQGAWKSEPGTSTLRFSGSLVQAVSAQNLKDNAWHHIEILKTGGDLTWNGPVTSTGNVSLKTGTLLLSNSTWNLYGNFTMSAGTLLDAGSGTQNFLGNAGQSASSTGFASVVVNKGAGASVTFTGNNMSINKKISVTGGILNLGNGRISFGTTEAVPIAVSGSGQLQAGNGTVAFSGSGGVTQTIGNVTFNHLEMAPGLAKSYTIGGNVTVNGNWTVGSFATVNTGSHFVTVAGEFTNSGTVNRTTGGVKRSMKSIGAAKANGSSVLSDGDLLFVTVDDPSVNLKGNTKETVVVTVSGSAATGGDSELITLTETANASGVFTNASGITVNASSTASAATNNGTLEATGSGTFQALYTDTIDGGDFGTAEGSFSVPVSEPPPDTNVSAAQSSVTISPTSVPANNASTTAVTVTVKNAAGSSLSGKNVTLTSSRPSSDTITVTGVDNTTNASGQVSFTVKSTTAGTSTLTADLGGGATLTGTVTFTTPPSAPAEPETPLGETPTSSEAVPGEEVVGGEEQAPVAGGEEAPVTGQEEEPLPGSELSEAEITPIINDAIAQQAEQIQSVGYVTDVDATRLSQISFLGLQVHSLIKLPDDGNPNTQADSAVYYIGGDGRRHAFPNELVFRTWFCDFSKVQTVTADQLSTISLGHNVTYQPGQRLVKFVTGNKVYAVDKGGVLRWVTTPEAATAIYGSDWTKKVHDINDAFFNDYTFGTDIGSPSQYNAIAIQRTVTYPSDSMRIQGFVTSAVRPAIEACAVVDSDQDGLSDDDEKARGTSPADTDTDNDGLSDGDEVNTWKTDPLNSDTDGDGLADFFETTRGWNPLSQDTDGDGYPDKTEYDNGYDPNGPGQLTSS